MKTLILPGLYDSGPEHWQSKWEASEPAAFVRVVQRDWETPECTEWVETLEHALGHEQQPVLLAAHSSSCAMVAHWARAASNDTLRRVHGALLVAPSDPDGPNYPLGPIGFAPVPLSRLPFPSIVVASEDDEYVTLARAREYADAWGSRLVNVGAVGHVNSTSGLGDWPAGRALLAELASEGGRRA